MDDFEEKLNSILSSPEAMGQIMALADSLTGQTDPKPTDAAPPSVQPPVPSGGGGSGLPDLSGLASAFSGGSNPLAMLQNLDPSMLQTIGALFQEYNRSDDEKAALLHAMGESGKAHTDHPLVSGDPSCHAAVSGERLCIINSFPLTGSAPSLLRQARHPGKIIRPKGALPYPLCFLPFWARAGAAAGTPRERPVWPVCWTNSA